MGPDSDGDRIQWKWCPITKTSEVLASISPSDPVGSRQWWSHTQPVGVYAVYGS